MTNISPVALKTDSQFNSRDSKLNIALNPQQTHEMKTSAAVPSPTIHVNISAEGKEKLAQEQTPKDKDQLGKELVNQTMENAKETDKKVEKSEGKHPIELLIEDIKKRIEEVKQKLALIQDDNSETALEQKKMLSEQLVELNSQLLSLFEQKRAMMRKQGGQL